MLQLSKREVVFAAIGAAAGTLTLSGCASQSQAETIDAFAQIEKTHGGRLGVCIRNTQTNRIIHYRGEERFAMCSTFKLPLAAIILRKIERGEIKADSEIPIVQNGLKTISPFVERMLPVGKMRIIDLAKEIQTTSDNIAANALLELIGGPNAFTSIMHELGDNYTNVTLYEPRMNSVRKGDTGNTTTPIAFAQTVQKIIFGQFFSPVSIQTLADWMIETKTGVKRLRAGLPSDWRVGDKTGTGVDEELPNRYNDVAVVWPQEKPPHIIAAYYEAPGFFDEMRDIDQEALAKTGRIAAQFIS